MKKVVAGVILMVFLFSYSGFSQDNEEWLLLDDKLEMVMDASADKIDGDPDGSAAAQRYNQMSQDALAWKYDFTNFTDNSNDDHWIDAGIFNTLKNATNWWKVQGLDNPYGDPEGNGNDQYNYQNTDFAFDTYTGTLTAYGMEGLWIEGTLSFRIDSFIFQSGPIQRVTHKGLIDTLVADAKIMMEQCAAFDLFGELKNEDVEDFIIEMDDEPPFYQYEKVNCFRFFAMDANGNNINYNSYASISAFDENGQEIKLVPEVITFHGGQSAPLISFEETSKKAKLKIELDSVSKTSDAFEIRPRIIAVINGYTGGLIYNNEVTVHAVVQIYNGVDIIPFSGEGTARFFEHNGLGSFANEGILEFDGNRPEIQYRTPTEEDAGNQHGLTFDLEITIDPWTLYEGEDNYYHFPDEGGEEGKLTFAEAIGGTGYDNAQSVAMGEDPSIIYVFGEYSDTVSFGDYTLTADEGDDQLFFAKYQNGNLDPEYLFNIGGPNGRDKAGRVVLDKGTTILDQEKSTRQLLDEGRVGLLFDSGGEINLHYKTVNRPPGYHVVVANIQPNGQGGWSSVSDPGAALSESDETRHSGSDMVIDEEGNTCVTGHFFNYINFTGEDGSSSWSATGQDDTSDLFMVKFSPEGEVLWGYHASGEDDVEGQALAVDSEGNIYFAGQYDQDITLGTEYYDDARAGFIMKFLPDGEVLWTRQIEGYASFKGLEVTHDDKHLIVLFHGNNSTVFAGLELEEYDYYSSVFLAKMTTDGDPVFLKPGKTNTDDISAVQWPCDLALDPSDNIYITGSIKECQLGFDDVFLAPEQTEGLNVNLIFVFAFDPDGNVIWCEKFGDNQGREVPDNSTFGDGIIADEQGNCYVSGTFRGTVAFGDIQLTSAGKTDGFLIKIGTDSTGKQSYTQLYPDLNGPQFSVYPNSFSNELNIVCHPGEAGNISVVFYDLAGREVEPPFIRKCNKGENRYSINTTNWPAGLFLYKATLNKLIFTGKILKQ